MAWIVLFIAGLLETGWAVGLKYTDGFTRLVPTLWTAAALVLSLVMLSWAARELPIGTAYAVWVGIGAFGAAVLGIFLFGEPATFGRLFFLGLMLVSIAGLKLTSPVPQAATPPAKASP
jgi:quaternary ammonium compound-resistance protein SugE